MEEEEGCCCVRQLYTGCIRRAGKSVHPRPPHGRLCFNFPQHSLLMARASREAVLWVGERRLACHAPLSPPTLSSCGHAR